MKVTVIWPHSTRIYTLEQRQVNQLITYVSKLQDTGEVPVRILVTD